MYSLSHFLKLLQKLASESIGIHHTLEHRYSLVWYKSLPLMHYLFKNKIKHLNSFKPVYYFLLQLMGSVGCIHSAVNIGISYDIENRKIGPRS